MKRYKNLTMKFLYHVSFPVVNNFKALVRLSMAVFESSYCKALLAYLQNFIAFWYSAGDSWTPAEREGKWNNVSHITPRCSLRFILK